MFNTSFSDFKTLCSEEEEAAAGDGRSAAASLLQDPNVMAALQVNEAQNFISWLRDIQTSIRFQGKLSGMIGANSGYIQSLPAPVKKRLKALKKIQFESTKIEAQFYQEVHLLECKYHKTFEPLYNKRSTIIKGEYEPKDEECEWPSESEDEDETALAQEVNEKAKLTEEEKKAQEEKDKDVKGVPHFWLTIFKNVELIADMIQEPDEPALEALKDLTVTFTEVEINST